MGISSRRFFLVAGIVLGVLFCVEGCHKRSGGWGEPDEIVITFPKPKIEIPTPTLIPKLAAAFKEGKASIDVKLGKKSSGWSSPKNNLGWGEMEYGLKTPWTENLNKVYDHSAGLNNAHGHYAVHYDTTGLGQSAYGHGGLETPWRKK